MEFLGDRIRYLREIAEKKQKDMANEFSVSENTWSQYENNKRTPDLETLKKIAEFFNVSIDYLVCIVDERYNPREREFQEIAHIYSLLNKEQKKDLANEIKSKYKVIGR
ncbi:DNA-binding transcriptional regulator, XRE-family HTH domain [Caloranaerobacter azorensis DSM 13643]|uniref:DNA-binding transcriptional regulator, XRE-family HTH domain n=1 Tax=Caloranaerobacter azorensis DSM 13643 TaxID=1121264 RepID=A0A1M5V1L3_9FIRM|nr:helix-turn-helix transcriptional regulator [Caloranaerobacter azorensis]SHH69034.1 DNA-binding transcriptional regulator, XRE-family HTH domain [Caloranaerobacter azorensis DSM 13643]